MDGPAARLTTSPQARLCLVIFQALCTRVAPASSDTWARAAPPEHGEAAMQGPIEGSPPARRGSLHTRSPRCENPGGTEGQPGAGEPGNGVPERPLASRETQVPGMREGLCQAGRGGETPVAPDGEGAAAVQQMGGSQRWEEKITQQ